MIRHFEERCRALSDGRGYHQVDCDEVGRRIVPGILCLVFVGQCLHLFVPIAVQYARSSRNVFEEFVSIRKSGRFQRQKPRERYRGGLGREKWFTYIVAYFPTYLATLWGQTCGVLEVDSVSR